MKRLATILLLLLMLTQAFSKAWIVLDYEANKDFITKFLCINRQKSQLQCNGKCYLKKKLKKADQTENSPASKEQKQKQQDLTLYYQPFAASISLSLPLEARPLASPLEGTPAGAQIAVFQPPKFAV
ncbi:hypothetical protein [Rufibacter immobilis]|uniref:hypothetical protein n=1 Tax=Rufibacter immobilis TaxID=1348778 RepID=UPI0035EDC0B0